MKMSVSTAVYGETETNIKMILVISLRRQTMLYHKVNGSPRFEKLTKLAKRRVRADADASCYKQVSHCLYG